MYEVSIHHHGRPLVTRGPAAGCRNWPQHKWTRITPRPIGLARARALADAQEIHAVVCYWQTSKKMHDNGRAPGVPEGWLPARDEG